MNQCHACTSRYHRAMADYYHDRAATELLIDNIKIDLARLQSALDKEFEQLNQFVHPKPELYRCDQHSQEPDFFKRAF